MSSPKFWRDDALPFVEARTVDDGRLVCYEPHSHSDFSIGAITRGRSIYWHQYGEHEVSEGTVVLMNPRLAHACNPIENELWAYRMLYVDASWLMQLQAELGLSDGVHFHEFKTLVTTNAQVYRAFVSMHEQLFATELDELFKHSALVEFFVLLHQQLEFVPSEQTLHNARLEQAAQFIHTHCTNNLTLEAICAASGLSKSYLIRTFKAYHGMTPHAYLTNSRILYAQQRLKAGDPLAQIALDAGFADQAHFQRQFKRLVAATPAQYRAI